MPTTGTARADSVRAVHALGEVIDETRRLFRRLTKVAEQLHAADGLTAGERGVVLELARLGPRTVPQMAGVRDVSRQHIQTHVDALFDRALVERVDNPRHKRSKLIGLTRSGLAMTARVEKREVKVLSALGRQVDVKALEKAAETLGRIDRALQELGFASGSPRQPQK